MNIKFFYDFMEHELIVIDEQGERIVLTRPKEIDHFLAAYQLQREQCKGLIEREDRLRIMDKGKPMRWLRRLIYKH
ncbi:hypothetical protein IC620_16035 [Hazenella sp. IB182357]|uniref:Uncharacterized protein n=1 Tax=Polycladospora coralii TaxID=2771432 RepID=A0A926NDK4_9BACL|nr:hypothetical protein [Polycladospora coralii]MBD1373855.1 hypothetical protein [Polycladospora coralii]